MQIQDDLEAHGYKVNLIKGLCHEESKELLGEAKESVKRKNCDDIFNADDIPEIMLDRPLSFDASWEDRCKRIKASTKRRLPGIDRSNSWSEDFFYKILYEDRNFIDKQELFWLLSNPEAAKIIQQEKYHGLLRKFVEEEHLAIWKIKHKFAMVTSLLELGVLDLLKNPDTIYTKDSPEIIDIWKKGQQQKYRDILGRNPSKNKDYAIKYVKSLLKMFGTDFSSKSTRNSDEVKIRYYKIDKSLFEDGDRKAVLECINKKYQKYLNPELEKLDWSTLLSQVNPPLGETGEIKVEKPASQEVESGTDEPLGLYTFNGSSAPENNSVKSNSISKGKNRFDDEECIADLAGMLSQIDNIEALAYLKSIDGFTPELLNRAWLLLDRSMRKQIAVWQNQLKKLSQAIDRQIKRVGGTLEYWQDYLQEIYNVASSELLSDWQKIEFLDYLEGLMT